MARAGLAISRRQGAPDAMVPGSMGVPMPANNAPTSVEVFSGCGGLALGLSRAGFRHLVLAERDREALLMREEGLDYKEIAEALELSPGSVGTTLSRARRRLVESYEALQKSREEREKNAAS